jgi:hypothetical protein
MLACFLEQRRWLCPACGEEAFTYTFVRFLLRNARLLSLSCWSFGRLRLYLVTFAEDLELLRWVKKHLKWALDIGLLHVASGGDVGLEQQGMRKEDGGQARMTEYDKEIGLGTRLRPHMKHWHSSVAKNGDPWLQLSMMHIINYYACMHVTASL